MVVNLNFKSKKVTNMSSKSDTKFIRKETTDSIHPQVLKYTKPL